MNAAPGPGVSIVMPVHNALPHLDQAVASILDQTYSAFEFVIYDDASTDGSAERLRHWAALDSRIRLFHGERNLGPAASSNQVVACSIAPIVARMDADDIAMPARIQRQLEILDERADVGLVGTLWDVIDANGRKIRGPEFWRLARRSWSAPFPHGSIMFRREIFDAVGGYRDACEFWEDLDFVLRVAARSKVLVIAEPLYRYRQSNTSTRIASEQARVERAVDLRYRSIARVQAGQAYDDLLRDRSSGGEARVDPRVFVALGSLALWSNRRPRLVRRLLRRARLGLDRATATAIVWTIWARVSPSSLRAAMHLVSKARNAMARNKPVPGEAAEWLTPRGGQPRQ